MGVGTYLERFAAKFCVEPRRECLKIFYGDPFGDIFGLNWVDQGSGASSFTPGPGPGPGPGYFLCIIIRYSLCIIIRYSLCRIIRYSLCGTDTVSVWDTHSVSVWDTHSPGWWGGRFADNSNPTLGLPSPPHTHPKLLSRSCGGMKKNLGSQAASPGGPSLQGQDW